jgi:pimeloyl-ACP methyl ester carboxylesterase
LNGIVLSATWLSPSRYMRELFRIRLALLRQMPREYAAAGIFLGYPAEWINSHWTHFEATVANAPMDDASRVLVEERIEALLAFDGHHLVGKSGLPHLILGAADDMVVPAFLQRELALAIPAAEATFLESGGHFFPITRTKEFVQLVTSWADQAGRT